MIALLELAVLVVLGFAAVAFGIRCLSHRVVSRLVGLGVVALLFAFAFTGVSVKYEHQVGPFGPSGHYQDSRSHHELMPAESHFGHPLIAPETRVPAPRGNAPLVPIAAAPAQAREPEPQPPAPVAAPAMVAASPLEAGDADVESPTATGAVSLDPKLPPVWLETETGWKGNRYRAVASSGLYPQETDAEDDLRRAVREKLEAFVVQQDPATGGEAVIPPSLIDKAIEARHSEKVYSERLQRDMIRLHALVEIDPPLQHDLWVVCRQIAVRERLWCGGLVLAGVFATMAIGYFLLLWIPQPKWPGETPSPTAAR